MSIDLYHAAGAIPRKCDRITTPRDEDGYYGRHQWTGLRWLDAVRGVVVSLQKLRNAARTKADWRREAQF
jgi:hypothetical protein